MNNKGFAVTGFIYTIFIIFIILLIAILSLFNNRKHTLDKLKKEIFNEISDTEEDIYTYNTYTTVGTTQEFSAKTKGYYKFVLQSPKIGSTNGSTVSFEIYLTKGEKLYILINSNGLIDIKESQDSTTSVATASYKTNLNYVASEINGKLVSNILITNNNVTTSGSVTPSYLNKSKLNENLNNVQYIKDCISGNSDGLNEWSEIKAIVSGDNKAINKKVISESVISNIENITDNDKTTIASSSTNQEQCVIVDLGRTYNLDMINILHKEGDTYYGSKTYVSSDNKNYKLIRNLEKKETSSGLIVSAYEEHQVVQVGNVYVPIKTFEGATWLRVFHHNVVNNVYWDSVAQSITDGGYDSLYKQSVLYNLENYKNKNNQYEFLLEYSDLDGYNRWIQTSNPIDNTENVTGYKAVKITWSDNSWYGLATSNSGNTKLDGTKGTDYYYGIGLLKNNSVNSKLTSKESTDLWVRIDNL